MKFRVMVHTCHRTIHLEGCQDEHEFKVNLCYVQDWVSKDLRNQSTKKKYDTVWLVD